MAHHIILKLTKIYSTTNEARVMPLRPVLGSKQSTQLKSTHRIEFLNQLEKIARRELSLKN